MKIEITEDFLIIRVPKVQAEKINLFELRAFIEQGKPIKTENTEGYNLDESREKLLQALPKTFTTRDAIDNGLSLGLTESTTKCFLATSSSVIKIKHGLYRIADSVLDKQEPEKKQNSFVDFSYYEKIINENFEVNKDSFLSTTAIFEILLEKEGGMLSLKKIGGTLQKMGMVRTSKRVGDIVLKGYCLKEKN